MLAKKEILTLTALFCLFFLLFQTLGCVKKDYTPETIQGEDEFEISLPENNLVSDSCEDVTGLSFSSVSYLANPQYPNGYSVCQDECIDLDTDKGTWKSYEIEKGDDWCLELNMDSDHSEYIKCCAYCPKETHYCPISKSCVSDLTIKQGLKWELECPYITLSWDNDEKAVSYEIIPFYDENKDEVEDGKCEEDISNTKERYFYYNLESSNCAAYYTGNVRFQIIPQYSDGLSIESYNTEWIDVSLCKLGLNMKSCSDNNVDSSIVPHNTCSVSKPYFCYDGNFIKDCSICGCPESWVCWENIPSGSICNPKYLYNYYDFEMPSDEGFLELVNDPYYNPENLHFWMEENFDYENNHESNFETYSPYEMYVKKKGVCRDMATFAAYVEQKQEFKTYRMAIFWKDNVGHMVAIYEGSEYPKEGKAVVTYGSGEGKYSYSDNEKNYFIGFSSFDGIAESTTFQHNRKGLIESYYVWNYDGFLVEEPVYKGKYYEYEDFSKYKWV